MNISPRLELKMRAKNVVKFSMPSVLKVSIVYVLICIVFNTLSMRLIGSNFTYDDLDQVFNHLNNGNLDYATAYMASFLPSTGSAVIELLLELLQPIIAAGFAIFLMNSVRMTGAAFGNLLDGFGMFWRVFVLNILEGLFIFLWSLLFFFPGIIASYRYRQAIYLLIDNPQMSPLECIRASKQMMDGRKMELFVLDLSFIGWQLLAGLSVIGWFVSIWTVPYINTTYVLYYEQLSGHPFIWTPSAPQPDNSQM